MEVTPSERLATDTIGVAVGEPLSGLTAASRAISMRPPAARGDHASVSSFRARRGGNAVDLRPIPFLSSRPVDRRRGGAGIHLRLSALVGIQRTAERLQRIR